MQEYLFDNSLFTPTQSAYRPLHSVETALVRVNNDILSAIDKRHECILVLIDFSSAFDTIDHCILLDRLKMRYGIDGVAHSWFASYISGRSHVVRIGTNESDPVNDTCGVPQGSVMGPLLFTFSPVYDIIKAHVWS